MIRKATLIRLLKHQNYSVNILYGCVLKISRKGQSNHMLIPIQPVYSWTQLRIMIWAHQEVFTFSPKIELLKWKLIVAINKEESKSNN